MLCVHSKLGYFRLIIHVQFLASDVDMDIGMFYGYEYERSAMDSISISPNCAFISLKINHAALYAPHVDIESTPSTI